MSAVAGIAPASARDAQAEAARLYEQYRRAVFGYCLRRLRRREDADDAAQTTFVYALMSLRRGVVPQSELAWLLTLAGNVCSSRSRAAMRRGRIEATQDLDSLQDVLRAPGKSDAVDHDALRAALSAMPETQRRAILLREWQGLSYNEIADDLGITKPATETLLFRARKSLARKLEDAHASFGLNVASLAASLRSLFAGSAAKAVGISAAVAASVAAGPFVERQLVDAMRTPAAPNARIVRDKQHPTLPAVVRRSVLQADRTTLPQSVSHLKPAPIDTAHAPSAPVPAPASVAPPVATRPASSPPPAKPPAATKGPSLPLQQLPAAPPVPAQLPSVGVPNVQLPDVHLPPTPAVTVPASVSLPTPSLPIP